MGVFRHKTLAMQDAVRHVFGELSVMPSNHKRFRIAMSFSSQQREFVSKVAERLGSHLGRDSILYDQWHEAEFARPRLGMYLPRLYREEAELVTAFLGADYRNREWCGLEWDAIFDLIKQRGDSFVMLLRFDDAEIPGLYSTHGCVWIADRSPDEIADLILERLRLNLKQSREIDADTAGERTVENVAAPSSAERSAWKYGIKEVVIAAMFVLAVLATLWIRDQWAGSREGEINKDSPSSTNQTEVIDLQKPELEGHEGPVTLMFTPDSQYLISAGSVRRYSSDFHTSIEAGDGTLRLWDMKRRTEIARLPPSILQITSLKVSPDGNALAAAVTDGTARVWTLPDGRESVVHREVGQEMTAIAFSPDSTKLAVGALNGVVRVFDWKSKKQMAECIGHGDRIIRSAFLFTEDGSKLISAATDGSLRVWDVATGTRLATMLEWGSGGIWAVFLTHNPNLIVVVDTHLAAQTIKLVDLSRKEVIREFSDQGIEDAAMSADGTVFYSIGGSGFHAVDIDLMKEICKDSDVGGSLFRIVHGKNSRLLVVQDKRVKVYSFEGFAFDSIRMEQEHTRKIISMEVSPDERFVITGDESGAIRIWDTERLTTP